MNKYNDAKILTVIVYLLSFFGIGIGILSLFVGGTWGFLLIGSGLGLLIFGMILQLLTDIATSLHLLILLLKPIDNQQDKPTKQAPVNPFEGVDSEDIEAELFEKPPTKPIKPIEKPARKPVNPNSLIRRSKD